MAARSPLQPLVRCAIDRTRKLSDGCGEARQQVFDAAVKARHQNDVHGLRRSVDRDHLAPHAGGLTIRVAVVAKARIDTEGNVQMRRYALAIDRRSEKRTEGWPIIDGALSPRIRCVLDT